VTDLVVDLQRQCASLREARTAALRERNMCVSLLARMAVTLGLETYLVLDPGEEEEWKHMVGIELPAGQVTFHVHQSELMLFGFLVIEEKRHDGHTTDEKWQRVLEPGELLTYVSMRRANGDVLCDKCGKPYRLHPFDVNHVDVSTGDPWLHVLCDGSRVKL